MLWLLVLFKQMVALTCHKCIVNYVEDVWVVVLEEKGNLVGLISVVKKYPQVPRPGGGVPLRVQHFGRRLLDIFRLFGLLSFPEDFVHFLRIALLERTSSVPDGITWYYKSTTKCKKEYITKPVSWHLETVIANAKNCKEMLIGNPLPSTMFSHQKRIAMKSSLSPSTKKEDVSI